MTARTQAQRNAERAKHRQNMRFSYRNEVGACNICDTWWPCPVILALDDADALASELAATQEAWAADQLKLAEYTNLLAPVGRERDALAREVERAERVLKVLLVDCEYFDGESTGGIEALEIDVNIVIPSYFLPDDWAWLLGLIGEGS